MIRMGPDDEADDEGDNAPFYDDEFHDPFADEDEWQGARVGAGVAKTSGHPR